MQTKKGLRYEGPPSLKSWGRPKLAGRKASRYTWGFEKPVGSVLDQERGPGGSTVIRLLIWPLGARAQLFHRRLSCCGVDSHPVLKGGISWRGHCAKGKNNLWSTRRQKGLVQLCMLPGRNEQDTPRETKLAACPGIPAVG